MKLGGRKAVPGHTGIIGPGRIEGNPAVAAPQNPRGSVVLEPSNCTDVHWEGFTVTQGVRAPETKAEPEVRKVGLHGASSKGIR